jgi:LysM repeat protein
MAVAIFLLAEVPSGWSQQQYLYVPTTVGTEAGAPGRDGVLVQDVAVQKGDTLYGLSRRFSGHGSYYPQILLFNDIKDPNKIYPGNVFKIPVPRHATAGQSDKPVVKNDKATDAASEIPAARSAEVTAVQKPVAVVTPVAGADKAEVARDKKRGAKEKVVSVTKKQAAAGKSESVAGQNLFERAVKAYRQEDCRTALELFDRFLADNQASPFAADASLYKAECYLKLSAQN